MYDAWGRPINCSGTMASTLGKINPFRYRGYVYDGETGLYYLRSRYYNPTICKFLGCDRLLGHQAVLLSHSGYSYCNNNPCIKFDPDGNVGIFAFLFFFVGTCLYSPTAYAPNDVGAAEPYREAPQGTGGPNCYSFALGLNEEYLLGEPSGQTRQDWRDASLVLATIQADMDALGLGYTIRQLKSADSNISENEYRIAFRCTSKESLDVEYSKLISYYDYHFAVQTATGQWADKHGSYLGSELHQGEGLSSIEWGSHIDGEILYFAIGK